MASLFPVKKLEEVTASSDASWLVNPSFKEATPTSTENAIVVKKKKAKAEDFFDLFPKVDTSENQPVNVEPERDESEEDFSIFPKEFERIEDKKSVAITISDTIESRKLYLMRIYIIIEWEIRTNTYFA